MFGSLFVGGVLAVFAAVISICALKWFGEPFFWIFLVWASVALCGTSLLSRFQRTWISLAIVFCVIAGLEGAAWVSEFWIYKDIKSESSFKWVNDDLLGYVASKDVAERESKSYKGKKLYDVVYTMDANGLRISSPRAASSDDRKRCVLFFGDSYTFGWGLSDGETLPYRVSERSDGAYRVYNLAFPTHGPQQMLAALEQDRVRRKVNCASQDVRYIIYVATPDHIRRAAGLRDIDRNHGPRYELGPNGNVTYQGQFGEGRTKAEKIRNQLRKSILFRKLFGGDGIYYRRYNDADVARYLAIVAAANVKAKAMYPNVEFHVLAWGNDSLEKGKVLASKMIEGLKSKGLLVHTVEDILPGSSDNKAEYFLGGWDPHPNATADDRIADYLVSNVLKH